jgi:ABC-type polysaccharide/polyol phosphate export permease
MSQVESVKQIKIYFDSYYWRSAFLIAHSGVARQYRNSYLGALWLLFPAMAMMSIYMVIMPLIMKSDPQTYAMYLLSTLPLWQFIANSMSSATNALITNAEALKRCMISSSVFPLADVLKNAYSYIIGFFSMAFLGLILGLPISWQVFLVPIYFIPVLVAVACMCIGIAYIVPYVKDLRDAINIAMTMMMWASAVVYPLSTLGSENARNIISWNPLYILLSASVSLVYQHQIPDLLTIAKLLGVMVIALIVGYSFYRIGRKNYVYYL